MVKSFEEIAHHRPSQMMSHITRRGRLYVPKALHPYSAEITTLDTGTVVHITPDVADGRMDSYVFIGLGDISFMFDYTTNKSIPIPLLRDEYGDYVAYV